MKEKIYQIGTVDLGKIIHYCEVCKIATIDGELLKICLCEKKE